MKSYEEYLNESSGKSRYSVEINYRTDLDEVMSAYAKICLGYVSAAMKNWNFHIKQFLDNGPLRIMISSRNWDDGEWVACISWNSRLRCFVISKGFYNKDRKSISVQSNSRIKDTDAAGIAQEARNVMHSLKDKPDRHQEKLKPVPLKRGPKS